MFALNFLFIGRIAWVAYTTYSTDVARSVVCLYVCLSVGHKGEPCKNC